MLIGVDFDNTIVCYDTLFHRIAVEQSLIPQELLVTKSSVRDYLRQVDNEDAWTQLQGYVYGSRMDEAPAYTGVLDFFSRCREANVEICVISHKTKEPFQGPMYDLHGVAYKWLEAQGFFEPAGIGLRRENVHFELTKQEKLQRIAESGCTHFIDDLPEFLAEADFPAQVDRILFDPGNLYLTENGFRRATSWPEVERLVFD